jgi:hypothetical protein
MRKDNAFNFELRFNDYLFKFRVNDAYLCSLEASRLNQAWWPNCGTGSAWFRNNWAGGGLILRENFCN